MRRQPGARALPESIFDRAVPGKEYLRRLGTALHRRSVPTETEQRKLKPRAPAARRPKHPLAINHPVAIRRLQQPNKKQKIFYLIEKS
jgi:hypothetical protein